MNTTTKKFGLARMMSALLAAGSALIRGVKRKGPTRQEIKEAAHQRQLRRELRPRMPQCKATPAENGRSVDTQGREYQTLTNGQVIRITPKPISKRRAKIIARRQAAGFKAHA